MEEKLRQAPSSEETSNTLKEEKTVTSAHSGSASSSKQEKLVEVKQGSNRTALKSEVPQQEPVSPVIGVESKLREIVNPEEPVVSQKKQETSAGYNDRPQNSSKVDEKLHTPPLAGAAAAAAANDERPTPHGLREAPASRSSPSQPAASSLFPVAPEGRTEQQRKLQEMPTKVASSSLKEDACGRDAASSCNPKTQGTQAVPSAAKEEKSNKATTPTSPLSDGQKEEKLQEAAPESHVEEMPGSTQNASSQPSDAASSPSCCSCF